MERKSLHSIFISSDQWQEANIRNIDFTLPVTWANVSTPICYLRTLSLALAYPDCHRVPLISGNYTISGSREILDKVQRDKCLFFKCAKSLILWLPNIVCVNPIWNERFRWIKTVFCIARKARWLIYCTYFSRDWGRSREDGWRTSRHIPSSRSPDPWSRTPSCGWVRLRSASSTWHGCWRCGPWCGPNAPAPGPTWPFSPVKSAGGKATIGRKERLEGEEVKMVNMVKSAVWGLGRVDHGKKLLLLGFCLSRSRASWY